MTQAMDKPGTLIWCGEHWINYLRPKGEDRDSAAVSLYHARFSEAGEGSVAFVDIPEAVDLSCAYTDNPDFAQFTIETMIRGRGGPFDRELSIRKAVLTRTGDIRRNPAWNIHAGKDRINASWEGLQTPLVGPPTAHPDIVFTVLTFADGGVVRLNDKRVPGEPYLRDIWRKNLGTPKSSCCFALAETMVKKNVKRET